MVCPCAKLSVNQVIHQIESRLTTITRQGNSRVRAILVEVAWLAIGEDAALATFFERLFPHTGKKRAIVAVARKLIGRIRAAFQHGESYKINYSVSPSLAA